MSDDAADTNLTSIGTTGINRTDNTISMLPRRHDTGADHAATATSGITGAGNVTVEDDGDAANSCLLRYRVVTVDAGTGNDTIDLGNAENVTAADTIDGAVNLDELVITLMPEPPGSTNDLLILTQ